MRRFRTKAAAGLIAVIATLGTSVPARAEQNQVDASFPSVVFLATADRHETVSSIGPARQRETAPVPRAAPGPVYVVQQPLRDVLEKAARRAGQKIVIASAVRGDVVSTSLPGDLDAMLDELAATHNLGWYRERDVIRVTPAPDGATRVLFLGSMTFEELRRALADAGLNEANYQIRYVDNSNSVIVTGAPDLVARVELVAEAFNKRNSGVVVLRGGERS